jgi:Anti-sigma-K factor rskA
MSRPHAPDFDELVGTDVPEAERDRLRAAHDLILQAGPPPELSPELEQVPWPEEALAPLGLTRRKRTDRGRSWLVIATAAAALVLVGFLIGQVGGTKSTSAFDVVHTVKMHGTAKARGSAAVIEVGRAGTDGNWPMLITVTNLAPLQGDTYYEMWLSKGGKPVFLCGSFNTKPGADTVVRLSAAYPLKKATFDGWVVTRHVDGVPASAEPVLITT